MQERCLRNLELAERWHGLRKGGFCRCCGRLPCARPSRIVCLAPGAALALQGHHCLSQLPAHCSKVKLVDAVSPNLGQASYPGCRLSPQHLDCRLHIRCQVSLPASHPLAPSAYLEWFRPDCVQSLLPRLVLIPRSMQWHFRREPRLFEGHSESHKRHAPPPLLACCCEFWA